MRDDVREQIKAVGYASVLVALKSEAASDVAAEALRGDFDALRDHFSEPGKGQRAQIDSQFRIAAQLAGRRRSRPEERVIPTLRVFTRLGLALGIVDQKGLGQLEKDRRIGGVSLAPELSLVRPVSSTPANRPAGVAWGVARLNAPHLWAAGFVGEGVRVGHLDTGIDATHPVLADAVHSFREFDLAGDEIRRAHPRDSETHGTATASVIVGRPGKRGAIGVAPAAKLASALVIEGGDVVARVLGGFEWMLTQDVRIINASLGIRGYEPAFMTVIDALRKRNVLPVFAIGNEGPNTSRSPGNYDNVLSVGAMNAKDMVWALSSSQWFNRPLAQIVPVLVAPGEDVLAAAPGGGYVHLRGTSLASPHVAGLAALLLQARPDASVEDLENAIIRSCRRANRMPPERANCGVPDALEAFRALTGHDPDDGPAQPQGSAQAALAQQLRQFVNKPPRSRQTDGAPNALRVTGGRSSAPRAPAKPSGGGKPASPRRKAS